MIYQQYPPHESLSGTIRCYWTLNGDAGNGFKFTVIPDYCIDIIFQSMGKGIIYIVGANPKPQDVLFNGEFDLFGIRFLPGAFYRLFGIPASELTGIQANIDDLGRKFSDFEPIQYMSRAEDRISFFNSLLSRLTSDPCDDISSELVSNAADFNLNHSFLNHYSKKTFNRRLVERVGLNHRTFSNILRIHRSIKLGLNSNFSQADIAYMAGFYDQAHYIKSFKEHTGTTPASFIKEIKQSPVRFLQYPLGIY